MDKDAKDNKLDIYFEKKYGELSALLEDGNPEVVEYKYEDENGRIYKLFIKRLIETNIDSDVEYYDITTPYGYGGPIVEVLTDDKPETKESLLKSYNEDFEKYCKENNIVSEFVRFHPILENAKDFTNIYEVKDVQKTIAIWNNNGRPFDVEFSSSARKRIRKNLREGMNFEVIKNPDNLDTFKEIYYETMDRAEAKLNYYFKQEYFQYIIDNFQDNIILVNIKNEEGIVIASAVCFLYKDLYLHIHLSGTRRDYIKQSPAYSLRFVISEWAYENGFQYAHGGGGTTSDPEDTLFLFKKQFSKQEPHQFSIGSKIFNEEIYNKLVEKTNTKDTNFFPKYRNVKKEDAKSPK